jgi:polygalacturonase
MKYLFLFLFIPLKTSVFAQYLITNFGAIPDGKTLNTTAIQAAIDTCFAHGGGKVIVPKGAFLTGTIVLKSGVNLHFTEGSLLLGSSRREDYKKNDWYALILVKGQKNVKITGNGVIDGQGKALAQDVERLLKLGILKNVKPYDRPDESHRPQIIEMTDCEDITLENIMIKNAACWVQTYHNCINLKFNKIRVESTAYWNNDGIDIVDCQNVLIKNCFIDTSDDGICLKSHSTKSICKNIKIERCTIRSSASAFKIGTASYGGFKHIRVRNLYVYDTYRSAIALECVDGGILEDVKIKKIVAKNTGNALFIRLGHRNKNRPIGTIKNIYITNLKADIPIEKPDIHYEMEGPLPDSFSNLLPSSIVGLPNNRIKNVRLKNIDITFGGGGKMPKNAQNPRDVPELPHDYPEFSMFGELPAWGFYLRHTEGVHFKNIKLHLKNADYRSPVFGEDVINSSVKKVKLIRFNQ